MAASARSPTASDAADLIAYVPRYVVADLLRSEGSPATRPRRFEAVGLFADMSGFTSISEAFAARGAAGAEELSRLLNEHFDTAIDVIERFGGSLGKIGGDSLSAIFPLEEHPDAPARAVTCALEIQSGMERFRSVPTSVGPFELSCKIGLALGHARTATITAPGGRLEWLVVGTAVDRCAEAEHLADSGEIVCDRRLRERCPGLVTTARGNGFWVIDRLVPHPEPLPVPPAPAVSAHAVDLLARFVHRSVAERIRMGHRRFVDEHRRIAVVFAGYGTVDTNTEAGMGLVLERSTGALTIAERLDGHLHQIDAGDKGIVAVISFGAAVAHEDDEERALRCALELIERAPESSIGIAVGLAFCGERGGRTRREYAAIGDTMNVAARLMQLADPGTILCTDAFGPSTRARANLDRREPVLVKGRRQPLAIAELRSLRDQPGPWERRYDLPVVGRDEELARVDSILEQAQQRGPPRVVVLTGEAGVGKSRLSAEIADRATSSGFLIHLGASSSTDTDVPFLPWRSIVRSLLGLEREGVNGLADSLAALDRDLVARAPLLGPILGEAIEDTELTTGLDSKLRSELMTTLMTEIVQQCGLSAPRLLLIEDCHWIDPASRDLLAAVCAQVAATSVVVLATARPFRRDEHELAWLHGIDSAATIRLAPLDQESMHEYLALTADRLFGLDREALGPLASTLVPRAEGNAFYLEELLNVCKDRGIDPTDERALANAVLPEGLHRVVLARVDDLPQPEQATLRVASVIGRRFPEPWLAGVYPSLGPAESIRAWLAHLERVGLVQSIEGEPGQERVFIHSVVHEAIYATLSEASRWELHEAVGQHIEAIHGDDLEPFVGTLAHHYGASRNVDGQRRYFRLAADAARRAFANETAITYYERLVPIASRKDAGEVLRLLGEVRQLVGEWKGAADAFRESIASSDAPDDDSETVRARAALGYLLAHTGPTAEAHSVLETALADAQRLGNSEASLLALEYLAFTAWQEADYDASLRLSRQLVSLAESVGDARATCMGLESLGLGHWRRGEYELAREAFERALSLAEEIKDHRGLIHAANDLAGVLAEVGDLMGAFEKVQAGLKAARAIGYRHSEAVMIGNAGELYRQHGELDLAIACSLHCVATTAAMGDWSDVVTRIGNLALALSDQGKLNQADQFSELTLQLAAAVEDPYSVSIYTHYRAELLTRLGRPDEAQRLNEDARTLAAEIDAREVELRASVLAIRLEWERGERTTDGALKALDELERPDSVLPERAMLSYERWRLSPEDVARSREAMRYAKAIYQTMPGPQHRHRLETLTGKRAPSLEPFPKLSRLDDEPSMELGEAMGLAETFLKGRAESIVG